MPYPSPTVPPHNSDIIWCDTEKEPFKQLSPVPVPYKQELAMSVFAESYYEEQFMRHIDNLNVLYVALTRASRDMRLCVTYKEEKESNSTDFQDKKILLKLRDEVLAKPETVAAGIVCTDDRITIGTEQPYKSEVEADTVTDEVTHKCPPNRAKVDIRCHSKDFFAGVDFDRVQNINMLAEDVESWVPEARVAVAHGQMNDRDLERVMKDFVAHRYNILLCTTIIETGIDVPNANTMIMHRADKFGLAQLHQLRGRIGRSHHQAYAYLLVHDTQSLTKQAQRRLDAIRQMEELGSGFFLAMHDLEIRGAGEVLGEEQSGEMIEVGFQMYTDMLMEAVKAMREGKEPDFDAPFKTTTEINLHRPALLPTDYCAGVNERLSDDALLDAGLAAAVELKAVTYLARAEQCRAGLTKKLIEKKYDKKYVGMALDYLEKRAYLSDERFARAWLHDRKINHYEGRTKLAGELAARGIGREIVAAALDEFFTENDEAQICQKAYEKFTRQGKEGEKLMAAMIRAGFTYKMIKDIVQ